MDKLPADLLPVVMEQLVLLHLEHARRACGTLRTLLDLRLVCRSFSRELLRPLNQHITLPNLAFHNRVFRQQKQPLTSITHIRNQIITSALFNSTRSIHKRHLCTTITKCLQQYTQVAEDIAKDNSCGQTTQQLTKTLSRATVYSGVCMAFLFNTYEIRTNESDIYCIATMLNLKDFLIAKSLQEHTKDLHLHRSTLFGDAISCAVLCGHADVVQHLADPKSWPHSPLKDSNAVELAIELGNVDILNVLLGLGKKAGGVKKHGMKYEKHIFRAVLGGNVEVVKIFFNAIDPRDFKSVEYYKSEVLRLRQQSFIHAVWFAQTDVVRLFVGKGVEIDRADAVGRTAMRIAREKGFTTILRVLVEAGATVDEGDMRLYSGTVTVTKGKGKKKAGSKFWRWKKVTESDPEPLRVDKRGYEYYI
ncbi:uncharacterized protein BDR25DRAFT_342880 [Lindgomyces ingoldianus]|uniref:Uncharacterized protein n=1 Tax=Lindgomyces ingoldianus TaxID=673940 RepID=A0ACB6QUH5_9PLEO|nr:uncharacterized protein BDR25DRAFT_342880 [Lindgomyces ingoldianus]KAF2470550.1 hypothetical protein BDR25DRAFT_342880 [Lindgomyces ingoldianus]